jgi:hypothetical protein
MKEPPLSLLKGMRRRREKKTEKTPPMMDEVFDLSRWSCPKTHPSRWQKQ